MDTYPLRFDPVYKDYLWGGSRLSEIFNRLETPEICAESWEIADRPEGMSIVSNGTLKGKSLHELVSTYPSELCGKSPQNGTFPLLIKLIDAKQRLSVQVHPNNSNAKICGGDPKTEMWYILEAEPGAEIMAGLKDGTDEVSFAEAMNNKTLQELIVQVPIKTDQAIFIPGGRIHAIGEGALILEIQQNSNTTYRVYDWDRVGRDGKPRELHIDQAIKAINWQDNEPPVVDAILTTENNGNAVFSIIKSPYFTVERLEIRNADNFKNNGESFHALFVAEGEVEISGNNVTEKCSQGSSVLIPASLSEYAITPVSGTSKILRSSVDQS